MKKKKFVIFVVIIVLAFGGFMIYNSQKKPKVDVVKTTTVENGDIQTWLSTDAILKSKSTKDFYGTSGLTVNKVYVEVGDAVKKGDLLLDYDISDLEDAVEQARLQYDNAVLNKQELIRQNEQIQEDMDDMDAEMLRLDGSDNPQDIARLQSLIQQREAMKTISAEKFQLMDNSIALAKMGLDSAIERLGKVKDGLSADRDGVVTALSAKEDAPLSPAAPAVVLQDVKNLKGVIKLGKYDAAKIRLGQPCRIENAGKTYEGTLTYIAPAATASMGMAGQDALLEAELDIINSDSTLKIDFKVSVEILTGEENDVLIVPVECINYDKDDNSFVFIVTDGKAVRAPVKLGLQSDTEAEVLEGVKAGDKVILNPSLTITDGLPVMEEEPVK